MKAFIINSAVHVLSGLVYFISAGAVTSEGITAYSIIMGIVIIDYILVFMWNRELIEARSRPHPSTKTWDKKLMRIFFVFYIIVLPLITGLDSRLNWSDPPSYFQVTGIVIYAAASLIIVLSMIVNRHFEGTLVIRSDRDHRVVRNGPYRFVRHPGYLGMIVANLGFPMMIRSMAGFIPAVIMAIIIIIRTYLEDRMLRHELTGYEEYCRETQYRIIPFIW